MPAMIEIVFIARPRLSCEMFIMPNEKGRHSLPPLIYCQFRRKSGPKSGFGFDFHRTGILALGAFVAIHELDDRHRSVIAVTETGLQYAGITARTALVAGADHVEQFGPLIGVLDLGQRLATGVQIGAAAARQGHQLFNDGTQVLRLGQRGLDLLMLDQRGSHVTPHRLAMRGGAVELAALITVTHGSVFPGLSIGLRNAWRDLRYSPAASRALPCPGEGPSRPGPP